MAEPPMSSLRNILVYGLLFLIMMGNGILTPITAYLAGEFSLSPFEATSLVWVYPLMQVVFSPILGWASDRAGRKAVILFSSASMAFGYMIFSLSASAGGIVVSRLIGGATAGSMPVLQAYLSEHSDPSNRTKVLGGAWMAASLGLVGGYLLSAITGSITTTHLLYIVPSGLVAFTAAMMCLLVVIVLPGTTPSGRGRSSAPQLAERSNDDPDKRWFRRSMMAYYFAGSFFAIQFSVTMPLWLHSRYGWGPGSIAAIMVMNGAFSATVQGKLASYWSSRAAERLGLVCSFTAVMLGFLNILLSAAWWPLAMLSFLLVSLGFGMLMPTALALITRTVNGASLGRVLGIAAAMTNAGAVTGPALAGYLIGASGFTLPYLLSTSIALAAAVAVALQSWPGERRGQAPSVLGP